MSRKFVLVAFVAAFGIFGLGAANAQTLYQFPIEPGQVVPASLAAASGIGTIELDAGQANIQVYICHDVANANSAMVYFGAPGAGGVPVINLSASPTVPNPITGTFPVTPQDVTDLQAGNLYVEIQDGAGNDIRGQITNLIATPQVFISEYVANPSGGAGIDTNLDGTINYSEDEFIEIVNGTMNSVDIGGWQVHDAYTSGGNPARHTFAGNTILPPGGAITVFGGGGIANFLALGRVAVTPNGTFGDLGFNNGGDTIELWDNTNAVIDSHSYPAALAGLSEVRNPAAPGAPFVPHNNLPGAYSHSAGQVETGTGVLINWCAGALPTVSYPGTGEDLYLLTGIGVQNPNTGPGNDIKQVFTNDELKILLDSPLHAFSLDPYYVLVDVFPTGSPFPAVLPTVPIYMSLLTFFVLVDGVSPIVIIPTLPPVQPVLPWDGLEITLMIPDTTQLSGFSMILQGMGFDPSSALNGSFAITDGHEIQFP